MTTKRSGRPDTFVRVDSVMTRKSPKSGPNIYEVLEPLSGSHQELVEPEAMSLIKGMMTDQKRESNRRALPELAPVTLEQTELADKQTEPDEPVFLEETALPDAKWELGLSLLREARKPQVWLFPVFCVLFFSGVLSAAMLFVVVLALLLVLIFGPEPVLDMFFPNWRAPARITKIWSLVALKKRAPETRHSGQI